MSTVVVNGPEYNALDWPAFLIEVPTEDPEAPSTYYHTLAVWEYFKPDAGGDPVREAGCDWAKTEFGLGTPTAGAVLLREVARGAVGGSGNQTNPLPPPGIGG
jgi:hypothetical protein